MNLTPIPVTSIFNKARDPWFNHDAAEWVYETVMKMDADEAEMFTYLVAYEMLDADIQGNLRTFQKRLDEVVAKRFEQVKKAVVEVSKARGEVDDGFADAVQTLEEICKKKKNPELDWDPKLHPRGNPSNAGQFRRSIKHPLNTPIYDEAATAMGVPDEVKNIPDLDAKKQAQAEYLQVADFLENYKSIGDSALDRIIYTVRDKNDPSKTEYRLIHTGGDKPKIADWDPTKRELLAVQAFPQTTTVGGAAFDLGRALGGSRASSAALGQGVETFHEKFPGFADEWVKPGSVSNDNERRFRRVQHTAGFVGAFAPPGSHVAHAAQLAELVGQHGPEAEKVIGPHMRKTAYRYRGTQKDPDNTMVLLYNRAITQSKLRGRDPEKTFNGQAVHRMASDRAGALKRNPTWEERGAGRAELVDYFRNPANGLVPDKRLYGLQLAAGTTPPSEGVIIDKHGKITTQAVGYGDDHYLPFNLRSLKGLRGGEYIRTRSVGGPTSEDIYTGLATGARQVTVVSRSGVFTIEFDETFKGGRRYNDKSKRMTDRYEHLLDAVESEQIDNQPVPPEVKEMIEAEVESKYKDYPAKEKRHYYNQKIDEYKSFSGLDEHDQALIDTQMRTMPLSDLTDRQVKTIRSDLAASRLAEKEFKFRLNGDGYFASMQALKEQFPYYIANVGYQPKREIEPEKDQGYVMPRHNRPAKAKHGYYNPRINGVGTLKTIAGEATGKIPASEANYQNWSNADGKLVNLSSQSAAGTVENMPGNPSTTTTPGQQGQTMRQPGSNAPYSPHNRPLTSQEQSAEQVRDNTTVREYRDAVWNVMRGVVPTPGQNYSMFQAYSAAVGNNRSSFDALMATKAGRDDARNFLNNPTHAAALAANPQYQRAQALDQLLDRPAYSQAAGLTTFDTKPYRGFPGKAYSMVASPAEIDQEIAAQEQGVLPLSRNKTYAQMAADGELQDEFNKLVDLRNNRAQVPTDPSDVGMLNAMGIVQHTNAHQILTDPDALDRQIDKLHRIRTLQANKAVLALGSPPPAPGTPPTAPPATGTPPPTGFTPPPAGGPPPGASGGTNVASSGTNTPLPAPTPATNPTNGMPVVPAIDAQLLMDVGDRIDEMEHWHGTNTRVGPGGTPARQMPAGWSGDLNSWLAHKADVRVRMQDGRRLKNEAMASGDDTELRKWLSLNNASALNLP